MYKKNFHAGKSESGHKNFEYGNFPHVNLICTTRELRHHDRSNES